MRAFITAFFVMFSSVFAAQAQEEPNLVIQQQLDAFTSRDVDQAFSFASPMIQGMFQSPSNFGQMVEFGYPMVWNNSETRFLDKREFQNGDVVMQKVMIRDQAGALHILEYQMVRLPQGWKINGVELLKPPKVGA